MFRDGFVDLRSQLSLQQQRTINDGSSHHSNSTAVRGAHSGGAPSGMVGMWPPPPPPQQLQRPGLPPGMPSVSPFVSARSNTPNPGTGVARFGAYHGKHSMHCWHLQHSLHCAGICGSDHNQQVQSTC